MFNKINNLYKYYSFIPKSIFYNTIMSFAWIRISKLAKIVSEKRGLNEILTSRNIRNIYFIKPENYTNKIYFTERGLYPKKAYQGFDVDLRLLKFISENLRLNPVICKITDIFNDEIPPNSIIITRIGPNPKSLKSIMYLIKIIFISIKLAKKNIPVITYLPDTWFPDAAIVASCLNSITGGFSVLVQSSIEEASKYGYPSVAKPVLWTFPPSSLKSNLKPAWPKGVGIALLSISPSGGIARKHYAQLMFEVLSIKGFQIIKADGSLSDADYSNALVNSKVVVTTNTTQDGFYFGSKKYRSLISPFTTTNMSWEAFSTRSLLITNPTMALKELGFIAGVHYLDIDFLIDNYLSIFPSDSEMENIATNGFNQFNEFTKNPYLFGF